MNGDALLEARDIEIGYGDTPVIADLSLRIERGSFTGLIGANGAGKTTLLLALSGQYEPSAGRVLWNGTSIYDDRSKPWRRRQQQNLHYKRQIGFVHENPFFYPYLATDEFLDFIARVKRLDKTAAAEERDSLLHSLDLEPHRHKPTSSLSMGMRKKLALASALLGAPDILFLDEALNGVDLESAYVIKSLLGEFVSRGGAVILSTHVLEVLERIAGRYVLMRSGSVIVDLTSEELHAEAADSSLEDYVLRRLRA